MRISRKPKHEISREMIGLFFEDINYAADGGLCAHAQLASLGYRHLLHHRLADAHRVDGIRGLVRGQHHHVLHPVRDGGLQHVVRANHVGLHRLQREKLATGHLLQGSRREHVVHAVHHAVHRLAVANVADVELHLGVLQVVTHVILLLLIPRKYADFLDVAVQKATEDGVAETAGAAGD